LKGPLSAIVKIPSEEFSNAILDPSSEKVIISTGQSNLEELTTEQLDNDIIAIDASA